MITLLVGTLLLRKVIKYHFGGETERKRCITKLVIHYHFLVFVYASEHDVTHLLVRQREKSSTPISINLILMFVLQSVLVFFMV